jgi:lipocalin
MIKNKSEQNYEYFMSVDLGRYIGEWIAICDN